MDKDLKKQLARIYPPRNWPDVSGYWLSYINAINPPGSIPSSMLEGFIGFEQIASTLSYSARQKRQEVTSFREVVFHEAVYFLHKASHIIGCSETDAILGAHTWSLSQAYQGMYFAAKSISHLLGGIIVEYDRQGVLIDIWPGISPAKSKMGLLNDKTIDFRYFGKSVNHTHVWQLFQHMLQVSSVDVWPPEYVSGITSLSPHEFAKQRNIIHYGGGWIFDDLFEFKPNDTHGIINDRFLTDFPYSEKSDFTFVLAQVIFRMAFLLLNDIKKSTNKLDSEFELINKKINPTFHPYYSSEYMEK